MRSASIAESILKLVTTPERAASVTGDLVDDASQYGMPRFWWHLIQTVGAMLRGSFTSNRGAMLSLAFRGFLVQVFCAVASQTAALVLSILIVDAHLAPFSIVRFIDAEGFAGAIASAFLVGRWIARRAPGREIGTVLTAQIGYFGTQAALIVAFMLFSFGPIHLDGATSLVHLAVAITMFAGSIYQRRRLATPGVLSSGDSTTRSL